METFNTKVLEQRIVIHDDFKGFFILDIKRLFIAKINIENKTINLNVFMIITAMNLKKKI